MQSLYNSSDKIFENRCNSFFLTDSPEELSYYIKLQKFCNWT
jgi:hypothetical protein